MNRNIMFAAGLTIILLAWLLAMVLIAAPAFATNYPVDGNRRTLDTTTASCTVYAYGRIDAVDATRRTLIENRMQSDEGPWVWTTRNIAENGSGSWIARGLLPATAKVDLQMRLLVPGGSAEPWKSVDISAASVTTVPQPSWAQAGDQSTVVRLPRGGAVDVLLFSFSVPETVNSFLVTGDVELTNCYGSERECTTDPKNTNSSTVDTRLIVQQRDGNGGYINTVRAPEPDMKRSIIDWNDHHDKVYHRLTMPVNPNYPRSFRAKVYVRHVSGNEALIENTPYSQVFIHKP